MRLALSWTGLDVEFAPEAAELAMEQAVRANWAADLVRMIDRVRIDLSTV
jgi:hypothetical protein